MTNDNVSIKDITNIKSTLKEMELIKMGETYTAAQRNNMYVKKDITEYYTDGTLYDRINGRNGFEPYEDIYPGSFFDIANTIMAPGSDETGTKRILICGLKMLNPYQFGGSDTPHIICCPATHFGKAKMNDSNTTAGGYVGSKMNTNILGAVTTSGSTSGTINQQLRAAFGTHLMTTKELLTNTVVTTAYNRMGTATGASSNWVWTDVQAVLFSEMEVYGGTVWSSSGFDTGNAKHQMPAFQYSEEDMMPYPIYYWLKDVVTSTIFASANGNSGDANDTYASNSHYVRPRFVLS